MIKAIETNYNGYRFRSRLEARWAVFFSNLGVAYEYEKEGFQFGDDLYLPDFWLPHIQLWVEIKGVDDEKEIQMLRRFRDSQNYPVACVIGQPGQEKIYFFANDQTDSSAGAYDDDDSTWCFINGILTLDVNADRRRTIHARDWMLLPQFTLAMDFPNDERKILCAISKAKSARFEHGERP